MQKITKSRPLKIRYLEFLVAKKFVFEELLKEYYKDKNFRAFLQLAENPETWKFVKVRKLLEREFGSSLDVLLAKCAVFGKFSVFTRSRSSSRVLIARRIWFAPNFLAAGRKHRRPKFINFTFTIFSGSTIGKNSRMAVQQLEKINSS